MKVSRQIEFHYCLPFEFTAANVAIPKRARERLFPNIERSTEPDLVSWTAISVENPVYVRDTRGNILHGTIARPLLDSFIEGQTASLSDAPKVAIWKRFTENLSANAIYYDYGVGADPAP